VRNEALHQRERWGVDQDGGKADADWFWLLGYLAGKALHDVNGKRLHHIITSGAALLNWHAHAIGAYARMRPGIEEPR
jgi:TnpA family transposase